MAGGGGRALILQGNEVAICQTLSLGTASSLGFSECNWTGHNVNWHNALAKAEPRGICIPEEF
jgi:hypothetical protein